MEADGLRDTIKRSLHRFITSAALYDHAVAHGTGLGSSDSRFLNLLRLYGPLTAGRLAELSRLTTGTVTGVIDRLERAGYVRRERDAGDRRRVIVTPVPEAIAVLAEHQSGRTRQTEQVLRDRSPDDLKVIASFLTDLLALTEEPQETSRR